MWEKNGFIISTDKALLDFEAIYGFITGESYWGSDRSREAMAKAINNSAYCFGVYHETSGALKQIGFARVISDLAIFGYVADVFILQDYRGKGLGKWLIQTIVNHPELKTLKRFTLFTRTPDFYCHGQFAVYDQAAESKFMERKNPFLVTKP